MSFLQKDVTERDEWYAIDTSEGRLFIPADYVGDIEPFTEEEECDTRTYAMLKDYVFPVGIDEVYSVALIYGYGARMSAPGYLDCTEWCVFDTAQEAESYLEEMYGDDDISG